MNCNDSVEHIETEDKDILKRFAKGLLTPEEEDELVKHIHSHTTKVADLIKELKTIFENYQGKIAEAYLCPLAISIKEIQQQQETILLVIERGKQ